MRILSPLAEKSMQISSVAFYRENISRLFRMQKTEIFFLKSVRVNYLLNKCEKSKREAEKTSSYFAVPFAESTRYSGKIRTAKKDEKKIKKF